MFTNTYRYTVYPFFLKSSQVYFFTINVITLEVQYNSENFSWNDHQYMLLNKASQMLVLTKRTCHFVTSPNNKRKLYLTLVRSLFEHASIVWRPVTLNRILLFERLQKNSIKWILNEQFLSYADNETYISKCKQLNILPIYKRFELNDLVFFHKIVHEHLPLKMPHYIIRYNGTSRLRINRLDPLSYIFDTAYVNTNSRSTLYKSFLYRVSYLWNKLRFDIRNTVDKNAFKNLTKEHLWDEIIQETLCSLS